MKTYHGTFGHEPFDHFDIARVATGAGIKYGVGIYLAQSIDTGFSYAFKPASKGLAHYIYSAESPDSTRENTLMLKDPISPELQARVSKDLSIDIPEYATNEGRTKGVKTTDEFKQFRKLVAMHFASAGKDWGRKTHVYDNLTTDEKRFGEIKASEYFRSLGYLYYSWPKDWITFDPSRPWADFEWNYAVLDESVINILSYNLYDDNRQLIRTVTVHAE